MGSISEPSTAQNPSDVQYTTLKDACDEARLRYIKRHPLSQQNHVEACKYMPGGNTRTVLHVSPFPVTITSAESCYLTTVDGHKYIDFLGEYTAGIYGHNNPMIREAVEKSLQGGWNYGGHSTMEQQLAKTICERFPAMKLVRFVNSGTEANTMALATALAYTQKRKILIFYGGYHGGTISGKVYAGKPNINLPHEFLIGKYNDIEGTKELLSNILEGSLAAILVEPMMGSGGCFSATPDFLRSLRDLATRHDALLVLDEVMTSRLGYHGLGHALNITPDLMTVGKWVGGGMTFGAFGGREDIMKMYDPRSGELQHPGTFNNNVFSMSAGIVGCLLLTETKLRDLNELGERMRSLVTQIFQKYKIDGHVPDAPLNDTVHSSDCPTRPPKMFITGNGSLMQIHFGGHGRDFLQMIYYHHLLEHGIYMAQRGFIALSIEISQEHVDKFVNTTDKFCMQWQSALRWE